jgi:hypothetical protein
MKTTNKYKSKVSVNAIPTLEQAADAWVRLCIFSIKEKKLINQNNNKKPYEYKTT